MSQWPRSATCIWRKACREGDCAAVAVGRQDGATGRRPTDAAGAGVAAAAEEPRPTAAGRMAHPGFTRNCRQAGPR